MSINNLERKRTKSITDRRVYKIIRVDNTDPYWSEGLRFHASKGWRNHSKAKMKKAPLQWQVRQYRSWKHNRKTQWRC